MVACYYAFEKAQFLFSFQYGCKYQVVEGSCESIIRPFEADVRIIGLIKLKS